LGKNAHFLKKEDHFWGKYELLFKLVAHKNEKDAHLFRINARLFEIVSNKVQINTNYPLKMWH